MPVPADAHLPIARGASCATIATSAMAPSTSMLDPIPSMQALYANAT